MFRTSKVAIVRKGSGRSRCVLIGSCNGVNEFEAASGCSRKRNLGDDTYGCPSCPITLVRVY